MKQYLGYSIDFISFYIILLPIEGDRSIYIVLFTACMLGIGVSKYYVDLLSMLNAISSSIYFVYQSQCRCLPGNCYSIRSSDPNVVCPFLIFDTATSAKMLGNLRSNTG